MLQMLKNTVNPPAPQIPYMIFVLQPYIECVFYDFSDKQNSRAALFDICHYYKLLLLSRISVL